MKFLLSAMTLFAASTTFAATLTCKHVVVDGKERKNAKAVIDPVKVLLTEFSDNGIQAVLTEASVLPYDAPALWYDRKKECSYSLSTTMDKSKKHEFKCTTQGVNLKSTLEISADGTSAKYYGTISASSTDVDFLAEFSTCQ